MRVALVVPGGFDPTARERVIPALLALSERLARRHTVEVHLFDGRPARPPYDVAGARVYAHGDGSLAARARRLGEALWRARPDVLHAFWASAAAAAALVGRAISIPVVYSVGGVELRDGGGGARGRLTAALALRGASIVTGGSRAALAPVPPGVEIRHVALGPDRARFTAPPERPPGPPFRLLHVASLNRFKDQATLLQALALAARELPLELDVVGEDTLDGEIERLAGSLGLRERVRFHGFLPHDELPRYFRAAHLHVLSSRFESQCLAVSEAALAGLPTAGTAVGLLPELAPEGAWIAPVGDAAELARGIVNLLRDEPRRLALGRQARLWALENDADACAARFEAIYRELT